MRAVWMNRFGGPEVLVAGDARDPVAGAGQALIDVAFANITFVETQFRASGRGPFKAKLPMIPGNGVGGVVASVGAGADAGLVGTRVVSGTGGAGGYAEQAAVDAGALFAVPDGLALDSAVALLADGRTATMLVRAAGLRAGERALVEAAAGGVGSLLVQLARVAGAQVVAAAGGARKLERGGRMLSFGLASGEWADISEGVAAERGVALVHARATPEELRAHTERALAEGAAGRLWPVIGQRFPLERAADAHAAIQSRATVGKTLLEAQGTIRR